MFKNAISLVVATILSMVAATHANATITPSAGDDMSNYTATVSSNRASSINSNTWYLMRYQGDWWQFISSTGTSWGLNDYNSMIGQSFDDASSLNNALIRYSENEGIQSILSNYLTIKYNNGWILGSSSSASAIKSYSDYNFSQWCYEFGFYNSRNSNPNYSTLYCSNGQLVVSSSLILTTTYGKWVVYPVTFKEKTTTSFSSSSVNAALGDAPFTLAAETHPNIHSAISLSPNSYVSSNTSVARVSSDGTVTIVGVGNAVITAKYEGSDDYVGSQESYELYVTEKPTYWAPTQTIVSGSKYIVVFQGNDESSKDEDSGFALDGSQTENVKKEVNIDNKIIIASESYAFTITSSGDNKYVMKGQNNRYINPTNNGFYSTSSADLEFEPIYGGFKIKGTKYFSYENKSQSFYTSSSGKCLYLYTPVSISFAENEISLHGGEKKKNLPIVTPSSVALSFVYSSSDETIATVASDGSVTGKSSGVATITAKCGPLEATYNVIVTSQSPNLQFATVDNVSAMYVGDELKTTYSRNGDGAVTYSSSNNNIAVINAQGVITGVSAGTVTLTATVAETAEYSLQSKSITIEVSLKDPQLSFATENGSTQIAVGDQLKTKASSLSEATIVYTSSNTGVATIDNKGVITGEGVGTATLTATVAAEGSYKGATKSLVVTVGKRSANVVPSFTSKTVRVGGTAVLKLITESNGNQHFVSDNTAIATINATTGEITGIAEGTATIRYWVDASAGYAASDEGSVTVTVSNKLEPIVEVNPGSVSLAIGGRKEITVDLGDYTGDCSAVSNNDQIASVVQKSHDAENHLYVFSVNGIKSGETFLTLSLTETNNHTAKEIKVPITVLNIYQYELTVVNAPANGVAIQIWGVTYTDNTIFNSSHSSIIETDVNVRYLPSYSSAVSISGRNITVTYSLKEAAKGTFLRLKNYNCGKYATLSADGSALDMTEKGMDNIIYYDEQGHFLFYRNGQFVKSVNKMASVAEASEADVFTFTRGTGVYSECFSIKSGSQYLLGSASGTSVGTTEGSEYAYWHLEMLEFLPVMVSANGYGYASLYSPVELEVSGGLSAYYIDSKTDSHDDLHNGVIEYNLHLEQLMSVIPANTPVILVGVQGTTYNCPIKYESTQSAPVSADALTGHYAAQVSTDVRGTGTIYALQTSKSEETVGFYPWTKETMSGFKCYFVETNASPAPYYRLVFGAETSLEGALIETTEDSAAFNLHGQRVGDSRKNLPSGLYIVRGKKIIVK